MKYFINFLKKTLNLILYTMFSAVQRSRVFVMVHVIFFVIHR